MEQRRRRHRYDPDAPVRSHRRRYARFASTSGTVGGEWDFAYVEVSGDGGETWTILETTLTTNENPNGTSFGPGITGESTGWVEDSVDLTPYAGGEVLIRFEYVTDDAVNGRGLCLDDFVLAEIGWTDDAESDGGWEANGFARLNNLVPEEFLVQIVRKGPGGRGRGHATAPG